MTYFAIIDIRDGDPANPEALIRMIREPNALSHEYYDPYAHRWVVEPELLRYTHRGEVGAEEITEEQARTIIARWPEEADGPPA